MRSSGNGNRDMLKCCYGYLNHGSRKPAGPLKFSARTVTKKIPDPFVSSTAFLFFHDRFPSIVVNF